MYFEQKMEIVCETPQSEGGHFKVHFEKQRGKAATFPKKNKVKNILQKDTSVNKTLETTVL